MTAGPVHPRHRHLRRRRRHLHARRRLRRQRDDPATRSCDDGTTNGQPDPLCSTGAITRQGDGQPPAGGQPADRDDGGGHARLAHARPAAIPTASRSPSSSPTAPGRGTLTGTPPALTYTPAPDANGIDTFTFTANDGKDQSAPATVTINVTEVNDPPVPQPDTVTARRRRGGHRAGRDAGGQRRRRAVRRAHPGADRHRGHRRARHPRHGHAGRRRPSPTYPDAGFTGTARHRLHGVRRRHDQRRRRPPLRGLDAVDRRRTARRSPIDQSAQTSLTDAGRAHADRRPTPTATRSRTRSPPPPQHGTLTGTAPERHLHRRGRVRRQRQLHVHRRRRLRHVGPGHRVDHVNDVPVTDARAPTRPPCAPGTSVLVDVLANDTPGSGTIDPTTLAVTAPPTKGTAVVETGQIRYTANAGTSGTDTFSYTVCDTGGGCAHRHRHRRRSPRTARRWRPTTPTTSPPARRCARPRPACSANDTDPDTGDRLQARLVRGVTNGRLLLNSTGAFTYTPNGPGIDTFVYRVVDSTGAVSNEATVTIYVTGPGRPADRRQRPVRGAAGPRAGRRRSRRARQRHQPEPAPRPDGAARSATRPRARCCCSPTARSSTRRCPAYTGIDQFSYVVRDSEGRVSAEAHVGITVTAGGPPTATVGATSPGRRGDDPRTDALHRHARRRRPARPSPSGPCRTAAREARPSCRSPTGTGTAVAADFDPTLVRNGTYAIVIRAVTSGGGVLVERDRRQRRGRVQAGPLHHDVPRRRRQLGEHPDRAVPHLRQHRTRPPASSVSAGASSSPTSGSTPTARSAAAAGRAFTCGTLPVPRHLLRVVEAALRHRHLARRARRAVPLRARTRARSWCRPSRRPGSSPSPARRRRSSRSANGLLLSGVGLPARRLLQRRRHLRPDPVRAHRQVRHEVPPRPARRPARDHRPQRQHREPRQRRRRRPRPGSSMTFIRDAEQPHHPRSSARPGTSTTRTRRPAISSASRYPNGTTQTFTYDADHNLLTASGGGQLVRTVHYDDAGRMTAITDGNGNTTTIDHRRRRPPAGVHRSRPAG